MIGVTSTETEFHTEDTEIAERPTHEITIGSATYVARCPKMKSWLDTGFLMERIERAAQAKQRLDNAPLTMSSAERRELVDAAENAPSLEQIHSSLINYLAVCLRDDITTIIDEYEDLDSDLDVPDLYDAAFTLYYEFEPWFSNRAANMGLALPAATETKTANRRRASAKKPTKTGTPRRRSNG